MTRQHGTLAKAKRDGCTCGPCRAADQRYTNRRNRLIAYGRWQPYVDAEPVREHLRALSAAGLGWMRTAQLAGLSTSTVWKVLYGDPTRGQAPCKRVRPETAAALLAVRADLDTLADRAHVDAAGTRRRLQALIAIGWSQSKLAERLGMRRSNLTKTMRGTRVTAANARAVRDLYDRLWDADPAAHGVTAQAIVRSRNTARANGWPPPGGWDDDLIDLPEPELQAELARRAANMDDAEVRRCYRAARDGDLSPLVRAGAREYYRRRHAARKIAGGAA